MGAHRRSLGRAPRERAIDEDRSAPRWCLCRLVTGTKTNAGARRAFRRRDAAARRPPASGPLRCRCRKAEDRKSTRLNSSHVAISYAVFCLKKKNNKQKYDKKNNKKQERKREQ